VDSVASYSAHGIPYLSRFTSSSIRGQDRRVRYTHRTRYVEGTSLAEPGVRSRYLAVVIPVKAGIQISDLRITSLRARRSNLMTRHPLVRDCFVAQLLAMTFQVFITPAGRSYIIQCILLFIFLSVYFRVLPWLAHRARRARLHSSVYSVRFRGEWFYWFLYNFFPWIPWLNLSRLQGAPTIFRVIPCGSVASDRFGFE